MFKRNEIIGHWYRNEFLGDKDQLLNPNTERVFMKNLMNLSALNGNFQDRERQWIIGYAIACGNSKDIIDELETYQPVLNSEFFPNILSDHDQNDVKLSLVYNAIRAIGSDGDFNEEQFQSIYHLAKYLDITHQQVQQLQHLYQEEQQIRQKRIKILFPQGFDSALSAFDEH